MMEKFNRIFRDELLINKEIIKYYKGFCFKLCEPNIFKIILYFLKIYSIL